MLEKSKSNSTLIAKNFKVSFDDISDAFLLLVISSAVFGDLSWSVWKRCESKSISIWAWFIYPSSTGIFVENLCSCFLISILPGRDTANTAFNIDWGKQSILAMNILVT